ncbi:YqeG family HAD IIIA-type phosphatase [Synechococcus elongatus]|uniref:HAD-superfamily phosphatase subfamily IIIA n=3 Tax=Synechococcus elongatus TaxID=32046 RepID=Q31KJ3_SYNE7|nr:YqeG family HAD IIIA-type phosphatase [Synechococcus elongatus]ABB58426.1 HAD-superfamily phosphatase subfamily IIIA [Synechococcus elongatus PCC 7942 = FACHB-805]AJD57111.1 hydrolase [Synechococcus elongatus UTEX 2973]MBD2587147.1 YqeG family HAD IIIA-type phosphatase [Synechococcus elongatus FACHB-242]MBD2688218.1 YqeG family HAD IIIA-type phosphatase [Synechococcus elongatus FACHB-1061]MBD2706071.1 YqeG family HAD IIIA-type phosphatase [Synechococcus elongatus PCC 7942 = FACHB-805]
MTRDHLLQPDLVVPGSILQLQAEPLLAAGLQGLILDVDETLVPTMSREISEELRHWIAEMKQSFSLWLVSNNLSQSRIGAIAAALDLPYFLAARKPSRRKIRQAAEEMGLDLERVGVVGDRLFTDVLAGNRLGVFTVLVEPMVLPSSLPRSHWWRNLEVQISRVLGAKLHPSPLPTRGMLSKS